MPSYNMLEAKNQLSKLVEAVASGATKEIVIARNGKPAARVVPISSKRATVRFGLAKGRYKIGDDIDGANAEIAAQFGVAKTRKKR
jgi:prevent-host-death family protein